MGNWIDDLADAEQLIEAKAKARTTEALAASIKVQADTPEFVRRLELELRDAARQLSAKSDLHLSAAVSENSEPGVESRLHVQVESATEWTAPEIMYTDVFHLADQSVIRCHTSEGTAFRLHFAVRGSNDAAGVYAESGNGAVMTPAQTARFIVEPMVKRVRGGGELAGKEKARLPGRVSGSLIPTRIFAQDGCVCKR